MRFHVFKKKKKKMHCSYFSFLFTTKGNEIPTIKGKVISSFPFSPKMYGMIFQPRPSSCFVACFAFYFFDSVFDNKVRMCFTYHKLKLGCALYSRMLDNRIYDKYNLL